MPVSEGELSVITRGVRITEVTPSDFKIGYFESPDILLSFTPDTKPMNNN